MLSISVAVLPVTLVGSVIWGMKLWESIISRNWLMPVVFEYFIKFKLKSPGSTLSFFFQSKFFLKDFGGSHCWICSGALRGVYTLHLQ